MMMMIWLVWHYAVDDGFVLNMRMAYDRVDIRKHCDLSLRVRGALKLNLSKNLVFCPN